MIKLALEYAFKIAGADRVTIGVFDNNKPAYHCYKSAGFKEIQMEQEEICELFGEKCRIIEMAVDRSEYERK